VADIVRRLLGPYEGQLIDNGSAHFGAVSHYLAMLAGLLGQPSAANALFERTAEAHRRLREWPMLARTWFEHGRLLAHSGGPGAADAAGKLLDRSRALAAEKGFIGTGTVASQELDRLRSGGS